MNKKFIAILTALALVVTLLAPVGVQEASAVSDNNISHVPSVKKDYNFGENLSKAPVLTLREKSDWTSDFKQDQVFRLTLSEGAKWNSTVVNHVYGHFGGVTGGSNAYVEVTRMGSKTIEIRFADPAWDNQSRDAVTIPMDVELDGAPEGPVTVTVDPRGSGVSGGTYTFAIVGEGGTVATIDSVRTIGKTGTLNTIRIDETYVNALGNDSQKFSIKLPSNVEIIGNPTISFSNALNVNSVNRPVASLPTTLNDGEAAYIVDGRTLEVVFNPANNRAIRGTISISNLEVRVKSGSYGDITATISGDEVTTQDLVVARYADWGVEVEVDEVREIVAGKVNDYIKTGKLTIKENVTGSIISGRDITIELPSWVRVVGVSKFKLSDFANNTAAFTTVNDGAFIDLSEIDGTNNEINIAMRTTSTGSNRGEIELELELSVEANKTGDITAVVSGAGIPEQEIVIAKAVAPVTVNSEEGTPVRIGLQGQVAPDFTIVETVKEAIERRSDSFEYDNNGNLQHATGSDSRKVETVENSGTAEIRVTLPAGVSFANVPTVEVVSGNGEIDTDRIARDTDVTPYDTLVIPVKSESINPMEIAVSNVRLTVDRTVPEGDIVAKVGGSALVENAGSGDGQFITDYAVEFVIARTITPAPGESTSTVVFTIDSTSYTVDGKEMTMDVAPYIKDSRTFLPVRFVAEALGVAENNIIWEPNTKTVTIFKGDRVAQMQIGNKTLIVNGTPILMDTAPEIKDGRTMLPVFFVGQALGAEVTWDGDSRTVTVKQ